MFHNIFFSDATFIVNQNIFFLSDATNDAAKAGTSSTINGATASSDGGSEARDSSFHPNATHGSQVGPF